MSLPFSDHCDPLVDRPDDLSEMLAFLRGEVEKGAGGRCELPRRRWGGPLRRAPLQGRRRHRPTACTRSTSRGPAEEIFGGFHHSSTQRAVRRAEREGVSYEAGTSEPLLSSFLPTAAPDAAPARAAAAAVGLVSQPGRLPAATGWRFTWPARTAGRSRAS